MTPRVLAATRSIAAFFSPSHPAGASAPHGGATRHSNAPTDASRACPSAEKAVLGQLRSLEAKFKRVVADIPGNMDHLAKVHERMLADIRSGFDHFRADLTRAMEKGDAESEARRGVFHDLSTSLGVWGQEAASFFESKITELNEADLEKAGHDVGLKIEQAGKKVASVVEEANAGKLHDKEDIKAAVDATLKSWATEIEQGVAKASKFVDDFLLRAKDAFKGVDTTGYVSK